MKKYIAIVVLLLTSVLGYAQGTQRTVTLKAYTAAGVVKVRDTTTNTDTSYLWLPGGEANSWNVGLNFVNTQITGTTGNTMIVQGSNDATSVLTGHWYTIKNSVTQSITSQALGIADTATTVGVYFQFNVPTCQYKYLRIRNITSGTQTSVMTGTAWLSSPYITNLN
jgi:hypothetical protein